MGTYTMDMKAAHVASTVTTPPPITINKGSSSGLTSRQTVYIVHGVMMGLAWLIFFPLGAIVIRFLGTWFDKPASVHRLIQLGTLFLVLGAVGVGVYLATGHHFTQFHHYFGVCIIAALLVQAFLGWYHHKRFVRDRPSHRRWFTHLHLWLGRTTILCALANCGFGLLLAKVDRKWVIIWWIICGALAGVYFAGYIILRFCQRRARINRTGESFGTAIGPGYSAQRYARAETYASNNPLQPAPRYTTSGNENVAHERYELRDSYDETPYDPPPVRYEDPSRDHSPGKSRQDLHL